jgi:hypothetical protein
VDQKPVDQKPVDQKPGDQKPPPFEGMNSARPLPIFFNYGRYDVLDSTTEGLGNGQLARLANFVASATAVQASEIAVDGFASPEDNLPNAQLPLHRATAVKNWLDNRFASTSIRPTIKTATTSVLAGDPSTYPSLRRANVYVVSPKLS